MKKTEPILFYKTNEPFGCFANFSRHGITLDGKFWPTTEHYFQAQKFAGTEHEKIVQDAKTPGDAARLGRDRERPLREDWEEVKDDVMRRAVQSQVRAARRDFARFCCQRARPNLSSKTRPAIITGASARAATAKTCSALF